MDAHGGWVSSATDLANFAYAIGEHSNNPVLKPESFSMLQLPSETYSFGWKVHPAGKGSNWWATGSMARTTAILYHRSDGIIWAALFNASPSTTGDEFLVDVITEMGKAATLDKFLAGGIGLLII
jgi:hypothetical protein